MTTQWRDLILSQMDFYWEFHLQPRLEGLTTDEYLWKPADGAWTIREGADGVADIQYIHPEPPVPPLTTIAWRMAHVGRDVFGKRAKAFFGDLGLPDEVSMYDAQYWTDPMPLTAEGGRELLKQGYDLWREGIAALDDDSLLAPLGPKGGHFAKDSMAALALHLNRELMAHGAEICLLRDLYQAQVERRDPVVRAAHGGQAAEVDQQLGRRGVESLVEAEPALLAEIAALHHWGVVRALLDHRFPVTSATASGTTALHYAAAAGNREIVDLLLQHGADSTAKETAFGHEAAGWAQRFGHTEVAERLRNL